MPAKIDKEKCEGNSMCIDICPTGAIIIQNDNKAFVIIENCADCGACVEMCPTHAIKMVSN